MNDNLYATWGGKPKCFTEKETFQFLLECIGVAGGANATMKTVPCSWSWYTVRRINHHTAVHTTTSTIEDQGSPVIWAINQPGDSQLHGRHNVGQLRRHVLVNWATRADVDFLLPNCCHQWDGTCQGLSVYQIWSFYSLPFEISSVDTGQASKPYNKIGTYLLNLLNNNCSTTSSVATLPTQPISVSSAMKSASGMFCGYFKLWELYNYKVKPIYFIFLTMTTKHPRKNKYSYTSYIIMRTISYERRFLSILILSPASEVHAHSQIVSMFWSMHTVGDINRMLSA